ncbi:MAG: prepilin-type N-terminal cleavage/methylation domain-containing protein [Lutisporaceae bacterium]
MEKIYNRINNRKGFTLIELVIVIAIIGILAAVAIPRFMDVQTDAKAKADLATIQTINNAIEFYCAKENEDSFVGATDGAATPITIADGTTVANVILVLQANDYLKSGTSLNTPGTLAYEVDTNQVQ